MSDRSGRMVGASIIVLAGAVMAVSGRYDARLIGTLVMLVAGIAFAIDWIMSSREGR